jgi:hypothetical protein
MVDGLHILYEIEETSCNCSSGMGRGLMRREDGGELTNVQYKPNQNFHYEFPWYNEYIPRKIFIIKNKCIYKFIYDHIYVYIHT